MHHETRRTDARVRAGRVARASRRARRRPRSLSPGREPRQGRPLLGTPAPHRWHDPATRLPDVALRAAGLHRALAHPSLHSRRRKRLRRLQRVRRPGRLLPRRASRVRHSRADREVGRRGRRRARYVHVAYAARASLARTSPEHRRLCPICRGVRRWRPPRTEESSRAGANGQDSENRASKAGCHSARDHPLGRCPGGWRDARSSEDLHQTPFLLCLLQLARAPSK